MNIYQRMLKITEEVGVVAKNLTVGYGKSSYNAVGERDVLEAVKPIETKHGVYSFPFSSEIVESSVLERIGYDGKKSNQFYLRLRVVYRFVNVDEPEEYVEITSYGDGIDSGDKATGKAMTYAGKYALLKAYKISTGDDPDQEASPESGYSISAAKCDNCGKQISSCRKKNGDVWNVSDMVSFSTARFGKKLCIDCMRGEYGKD